MPSDQLIGIIGCEGSGKSTLIRGLFPGLELTNDDDGINVRRAPIYDFAEDDHFCGRFARKNYSAQIFSSYGIVHGIVF